MTNLVFTGQTLVVSVDFKDFADAPLDVSGHTITVVAVVPLDNGEFSDPIVMALDTGASTLTSGIGVYSLPASEMDVSRHHHELKVQAKYELNGVVNYTQIESVKVAQPLI